MEKENISIRKKACVLNKSIKISGDFLIPDTKPDIINVIGLNGRCIFKKEERFNGRARLDGFWQGNVIYLSDIGEIKSLKISIDFLENFENDNIDTNDYIEFNYKMLNYDVNILNERKIHTEIDLELEMILYKIESIEIISKLDDDNIQMLEKNIIVKTFINSNFAKNNINEDITLSDIGSNIEIIKQDVKISNIEMKISYNKVLSKADAEVSILYISDNQIHKTNYQIPVMSFIEIEGVKTDNIIDLEYNLKRFDISRSASDKNILNCDLEYEINCNVYDKKEIRIIEDLYSLNKDVKFNKQEVNVECISDNNNEIIECNEKLGIENIKEIYDYSYSLKKIEKSNGNSYEGILLLEIYYLKNDNDTLAVKRIELPFIISNIKTLGNFKIDYIELKSNNNEWLCNFKIACIENVKYENITVLKDCELTTCNNLENFSMIIYFVKPNDTVWKIAKNFKVSMDSILNLNSISDPNNIMVGEKLFIMRG